ncbi:nuclear transport factor 2 family protein [Reyranella sp. CPCC 100927]|uniref:nuclear transport factor 2 family protein n=1 Tax=Reyranella sp. CPCC 100927 TaxID=2599616 RepID=UPI0011B7C19A|nr:nuclear transport factor 2 family protein [Reyranella sp. CPCC 100927]TWT00242.1 nuclear transport factor 2 family protein [Reyranella sp. CPCC 100927]
MAIPKVVEDSPGLKSVFDRYHVGWVTRDPDLIASLHSDDTVFCVHDGSEPVIGREALRRHCVELFAKYEFGMEEKRFFAGADHWVIEWLMVMDLVDTEKRPFTVKIEMLDVVTVNGADKVTRKDVYVNGSQMRAAYSRAGLLTGEGVRP